MQLCARGTSGRHQLETFTSHCDKLLIMCVMWCGPFGNAWHLIYSLSQNRLFSQKENIFYQVNTEKNEWYWNKKATIDLCCFVVDLTSFSCITNTSHLLFFAVMKIKEHNQSFPFCTCWLWLFSFVFINRHTHSRNIYIVARRGPCTVSFEWRHEAEGRKLYCCFLFCYNWCQHSGIR